VGSFPLPYQPNSSPTKLKIEPLFSLYHHMDKKVLQEFQVQVQFQGQMIKSATLQGLETRRKDQELLGVHQQLS
jgi:hypothetical protein